MLKPLLASLAYNLPPLRGKHRILFGMIGGLARRERFTVSRAGVTYELMGEDWIDYLILSSDYQSGDISRLLAAHIGDKSLCLWDIGANVGAVSLPLLVQCPNLRSVMFEPSPAVGGRLLRNIAHNPQIQSRAQVVATALSNETRWTQFFVSNETANSGVGGLAAAPNRERFGPIIQTRRGDELSEIVPPPDVIKIDVEGFELDVIEGLGHLLDRNLMIIFEHNLYRFHERGKPQDGVVNFLAAKGYTIRSLRNKTVDLDKDDDFVASRAAMTP